MAYTLEQLQQGIIAADKAGDTASVQALGAEYRKMQSAQASPDQGRTYQETTPTHEGMSHLTSRSQGGLVSPLEEEMRALHPTTRAMVGAGSALAKGYLGGKQLLTGSLSPEDQSQVKDWNTIEKEAPVGAIAGNVALAAALPSSTVPRVIGSGAAYMALQPTEKQGLEGYQQRGIEAAKGAGLGLLGYSGARVLGRVLNPQTSAEVKSLMAEGITPTPGQIMGGGAKKAEEALRSVPIVGDAITMAHKRAIEDFNRAAINRSLTPIGETLPKEVPVGYKAVDHAYQTISQKYDDLLPKLNIKADEQFGQDITGLHTLAQNLNPAQATQFNNILKNEVLGKFTDDGLMSGETMKQVESKLGGLIRGYQRAPDYDQQLLGDALQEAQSSIRKMVERANPKYTGELSKVNSAYANLLRVENAAGKQGAKEGVFTPAQLESASRALDSSLRKRSFAHGKALMQDLATAGDTALAQKLPNSGTVDRALYGLGGLASGVVNPAIPLGLIGGAGLYTKPAQNALAALLTKRPDMARKIGGGITNLAPYAAPAVVGWNQ